MQGAAPQPAATMGSAMRRLLLLLLLVLPAAMPPAGVRAGRGGSAGAGRGRFVGAGVRRRPPAAVGIGEKGGGQPPRLAFPEGCVSGLPAGGSFPVLLLPHHQFVFSSL